MLELCHLANKHGSERGVGAAGDGRASSSGSVPGNRRLAGRLLCKQDCGAVPAAVLGRYMCGRHKHGFLSRWDGISKAS